jgi:tRNA-dihydrouridine synthase B
MRRHYGNYLKGISNIKPLRTQLVTLNTLEEIENVLEQTKNEFAKHGSLPAIQPALI